MLTYDALIKQAKQRGMPHTKNRGVLREYLQVLILKVLYKQEGGRQLYFTGGTYLRLIHNLKRFSEDLDFNIRNLTATKFEKCARGLVTDLRRLGFKSTVQFAHWDNILVAKLKFSDVEKQYNIVSGLSARRGIIIKLETNRPKWKIMPETDVVSGFGETYPCLCTDKAALFADKIDAFTKKKRGRHLYDIIFMLSNKFEIDRNVLRKLGIKHDPLTVILDLLKILSKDELRKQANVLRPFLFDESEAELVTNAHDIVPSLVEKYRLVK